MYSIDTVGSNFSKFFRREASAISTRAKRSHYAASKTIRLQTFETKKYFQQKTICVVNVFTACVLFSSLYESTPTAVPDSFAFLSVIPAGNLLLLFFCHRERRRRAEICFLPTR
jgi:hypothetical protein